MKIRIKKRKQRLKTWNIAHEIQKRKQVSPEFSKLWDTKDIAAQRVGELAEAELENRCIVAPVPIGTQLWEAKNGYVYSFHFDLTDGENFFEKRADDSVFSKPFSDFGITLFSSEQQAKNKATQQATNEK